MEYDPRNLCNGNLPDDFVESLESYILGVISIEKIRKRIGSLLNDNRDWGPEMLTSIDVAFQRGYLNGTAYRTLVTEIDLGTSEDEPTEWSEETPDENYDVEDSIELPDENRDDEDSIEIPPVLSAEIPPCDDASNVLANDSSGEAEYEELSSAVRIGPGTSLRQRYVLREKIGTGSMGDVYKALDLEQQAAGVPDPWVAIKVVSQGFSQHPNALEALKLEAARGRSLVHPNIIRVFDFDWDGDQFFMTMEWLEGKSLVDVLNAQRFQPVPIDQAKSIIQGLCHGLAYAHAKGIVHADVKPGNVFVTRAGHTKLLDFGIARIATDASGDVEVASLGAHTPAYSSCEVLERANPEPIDDVFSLACLTYRLLAGRRAFGAATALEAEAGNMRLQRIPTVTESQWRALQGALAWRRVHRTSDVGTFLAEFSDEITADMESPPVESRSQEAEPTHNEPVERSDGVPLRYGLPALAATLVAIALVLWWPNQDDSSQLVILSDELPEESVQPGADSSAAGGDEPAGENPDITDRQTTTRTESSDSPAQNQQDAERFEQLLDAANQRMDRHKFTVPANNSALFYVGQLAEIAPDSPEYLQTRLRLANLMLLEAMVKINDENFAAAKEWIARTRSLGVPDSMIDRYDAELNDAREAKAARENEKLGAIFASATPAAILAEPDVAFNTQAADSADQFDTPTPNPQSTTLAMVLPGADPGAGGETAAMPAPEAVPPAEPMLTPLSALTFRRFVEPKRPSGLATRNKSGWVELRFRVDEKGETADIRIVDSDSTGAFDDAALAAIRKWRFEPFLIEGRPATTESGVRLRFEPDR